MERLRGASCKALSLTPSALPCVIPAPPWCVDYPFILLVWGNYSLLTLMVPPLQLQLPVRLVVMQVYGNIGAAIFVGAVILGAILQRRPASGLMLESALLPPQPAGPPAGQGPAAITLPAKQAQTGRTIIPPEQMPTAEVVWEMLLEGQSVRLRMVAEARSGALALWQHQAAQEPSAWQLQAADTPSYQAQQQGSSNGHGMGMQRRLV